MLGPQPSEKETPLGEKRYKVGEKVKFVGEKIIIGVTVLLSA